MELIINGKKRELAHYSNGGKSVSEIVLELRKRLNNQREMITSLRIDGIEANEKLEDTISGLGVEHLKKIEVVTVHPKELLDETLGALNGFCRVLKAKIEDVATREGSLSAIHGLADGLDLFFRTVQATKVSLSSAAIPEVGKLEGQFKRLIGKLISIGAEKNDDNLKIFLSTELIDHIDEWERVGIPKLVEKLSC